MTQKKGSSGEEEEETAYRDDVVHELPLAKVDKSVDLVRVGVVGEGQVRQINASAGSNNIGALAPGCSPNNATHEFRGGRRCVQERDTGRVDAVQGRSIVQEGLVVGHELLQGLESLSYRVEGGGEDVRSVVAPVSCTGGGGKRPTTMDRKRTLMV
jgi:hypothetical protein